MEKAFSVPKDLLDAIKGQPVTKTGESVIFRRFQAQCDEIDPKRELYSVYRFLCGYAHPTAASAFAFVEESVTPVPGLRTTPKSSGDAVPVTAAMCLVWAGRAYDEMVVGKPRKPFLRSVAKDLGLPHMLPAIS